MKKLLYILAISVFGLNSAALHADDDLGDCRFFNPAFGLCSVHSHNIGFAKNVDGTGPANPENAEDIAMMNEIIALKSTVIVQQMKQQYDTLNATIKRFKTQLEKAVLTSKLEAYTGKSSSSSNSGWASGGGSGGGSSAQNNNLGAEECEFISQEQAYDCLRRNFAKIRNALDSNLSAALKQLIRDMKTMTSYQMCKDTDGKTAITCKCTGVSEYYATKDDILECIRDLNIKVNSAESEFKKQQNFGGRGN